MIDVQLSLKSESSGFTKRYGAWAFSPMAERINTNEKRNFLKFIGLLLSG
jgi:hypothetical protein